MSEEQSINIDSRKLFNMGVNILVAGFIRQKPEDAKAGQPTTVAPAITKGEK